MSHFSILLAAEQGCSSPTQFAITCITVPNYNVGGRRFSNMELIRHLATIGDDRPHNNDKSQKKNVSITTLAGLADYEFG